MAACKYAAVRCVRLLLAAGAEVRSDSPPRRPPHNKLHERRRKERSGASTFGGAVRHQQRVRHLLNVEHACIYSALVVNPFTQPENA
jgi:hypothetical protein